MSGRYSNKTCYDCGIIRPVLFMRRDSRTVTGKIGGGVSGNPFAGSSKKIRGSIRVSSARKTVGTKEVWVCDENDACYDPKYYEKKAKLAAEEKAITELKTEMLATIKQTISNSTENELDAAKNKFLESYTSSLRTLNLGPFQRYLSSRYVESELEKLSIDKIFADGEFDKDKLLENLNDPLSLIGCLSFVIPLGSFIFAVIVEPFFGTENWRYIFIISLFTLIPILIFRKILKLIQKTIKTPKFREHSETLSRIKSDLDTQINNVINIADRIRYRAYDDVRIAHEGKPFFDDAIVSVFPRGLPSLPPKDEKNGDDVSIKNAIEKIAESEDALSLITWILAEKVMHADGVVDQSEQEWFQSEFELDASEMEIANTVAVHPKALHFSTIIFNKLFPRHPKKRELLINNLLAIATADGELAPKENKLIRQISKLIKMKDENYQVMVDSMTKKMDNNNSKSDKNAPPFLLVEDIINEAEEMGDLDVSDLDDI